MCVPNLVPIDDVYTVGRIHTYIHTYTHAHAHAHTHTLSYIDIAYIYAYAHSRAHAHVHTRARAYAHTRARQRRRQSRDLLTFIYRLCNVQLMQTEQCVCMLSMLTFGVLEFVFIKLCRIYFVCVHNHD